jgi:alkylation response protein AidB-like acyl-CoA dehydrogenase
MSETAVHERLIDAARRIAPLVRSCRNEGERERRLPPPVLTAMHEARLFRMYIPKALGGLEIDPITSMIVVEEIARADGAAAWNLMLGSTYGLWAAFLPAACGQKAVPARSKAALSLMGDGRSPAAFAIRPGGMAAVLSSGAMRPRPGGRRLNRGWCSSRPRTAS